MKDFDEARRIRHDENAARSERAFVLNGETFHYRVNVPYSVLRRVTGITEDSKGFETIDIIVETILDVLETPEDQERFKEVCASEVFPVTLEDISEIVNWLVEEIAGRPTPAPLPSPPGREGNGTSSTVNSSPQPAVASTT